MSQIRRHNHGADLRGMSDAELGALVRLGAEELARRTGRAAGSGMRLVAADTADPLTRIRDHLTPQYAPLTTRDLSTRALRALARLDVTSLADLSRRYTTEDLLAAKGLGRVTLNEILRLADARRVEIRGPR